MMTTPSNVQRIDSKKQRILVISPNWVGDAVIAQPLLRLLKQQNPECLIDVLAPTWVVPVWHAVREVDTVLEAPFKHGALQLRERWHFAKQLRKRGYSSAYILPNTLKFALIPWLAGIPQRVGYRGEMRYGLINVMHHVLPEAPRPMVSFYAALANKPAVSAPAPSDLPRPNLIVNEKQVKEVSAQFNLQAGRRLIVFAPGAEFGAAKRWPPSHFAELAKLILSQYHDVQIVMLGSPKDKEASDEIAAIEPQVLNLAGITSLGQAIAVLSKANVVVSNDSGLMNIASALNRPIIGLYGPTSYQNTPPFSDIAKIVALNLECAPCGQRECPLGHHHCMRNLSAGMVWEELHAILDSQKK
jgi:heptosyltransferase-2